MCESEIHICDKTPISVHDICIKSRCLHQKPGGLQLIVIDYLQLIDGKVTDDNRGQAYSEITQELKLLAVELDVPIILLSQLDRTLEMRADKRPQISDLHRFGGIERVADIILFIYRDEIYNKNTESKGIAEIIVAKPSSAIAQTVKLSFIESFLRFNPHYS